MGYKENENGVCQCKYFLWDCNWYYCELEEREMDRPSWCKECKKYTEK